MGEIDMEKIHRYTFEELKAEMSEEDALFKGTAAFVLGTTWIDYQRLKKRLEEMLEFHTIYTTFSTQHLRIVKIEQYEAFLAWRDKVE